MLNIPWSALRIAPRHGAVVRLIREWEVSAEVFLFTLCHTWVGLNTLLPCHWSLHVASPLGQGCFSHARLGRGIKFSWGICRSCCNSNHPCWKGSCVGIAVPGRRSNGVQHLLHAGSRKNRFCTMMPSPLWFLVFLLISSFWLLHYDQGKI